MTLLIGVSLVFGALALYPQILPVFEWATPVVLVFWGTSRFYFFEVDDSLTSAGGCLLLLGGFTLAAYRFVPMDDLTGAVAHLIPAIGIFVELFANHHRDHD
ncbi:hypothetical protein [Halorubrum sp. Atlit-26R]|uniref:hypothetical protein n=1 Tax=Halorubrum sp. Atlit-26R TaxID=2282128 RepID=UPI0018F4609D|nr:hypothetical protein [Halorubrum sp. Atlit-26R]